VPDNARHDGASVESDPNLQLLQRSVVDLELEDLDEVPHLQREAGNLRRVLPGGKGELHGHGMVWYGMVWYGMVWYGMVMVWYGMVWYGKVWYGMVWSWSGEFHGRADNVEK
jgi:hypothetical protein